MEVSTEVASMQQVFAEEASIEPVSTEVLPAVGGDAASLGAVVVGAAAAGDGVDRL